MKLFSSAGLRSDHRIVRFAAVRRSASAAIAGFGVAVTLAVAPNAQGIPVKAGAATTSKRSTVSAPAKSSDVDTVIALVKGGTPDAFIINSLKGDDKPQKLSPDDLLKLQKAGVSENILHAMTGSTGAHGLTASAPPPLTQATSPLDGAGATPYPADLPDGPARKRRVAVKPFDYSTVANWVNYWFNSNTTNIGEGIRSMLTVRLNGSKNLTMLERTAIEDVMKEQDFGASNRVRKGTNARVGQLSGADVMLYGDIVIFGRDDTTKRKGLASWLGTISPIGGAVVALNKSEKAVVGINLRLVDTETGEVIETAEARGESSRSSKDYAGLLGIKGAAIGAGSSMISSNFQETIIGEATSNAVTNIVKFLETRVPQLPPKARQIEGRVASANTSTAMLTLGAEHGVLRGDRFEILKINGEIRDPVTKDVIDLDAAKVGELVVDTVRDKTATGAYGGLPLSAAYATADKGYAARLMSK